MKFRLLILSLAVSTLAVAQKKELKNIEKAIEKNDYREAIAIFKDINESEVEDKYEADYTFYKAVTMLGNPSRPIAEGDELRQVIALLEESKEMGYDDEDQLKFYGQAATSAIFNDAQKKLQGGDQEAALDAVNYLLELEPDNDKMRENAANLAYRVGDFKTARDHYEYLLDKEYTGIEETIIANQKGTTEVSTFGSMKNAEFAVASGQYENARIEKSDSQLGSIVTNLAWMYKNDGELDKAKSLVSKMMSKYPDDKNLNLAAADIYLLIGEKDKYEKAIKEMNQEIKDPLVYENLGIAAGEKGNWDQAIDYYSKSIELDANSYVSQNNLAAAYINKGNLDETTAEEQEKLYTMATGHLVKVLEIKPDAAGAKQTLIGLYKFLEMNDKAAALEAGN